MEAWKAFAPFDALQAEAPPRPPRPHPGRESTGIRLLRPDQPEPGKAMPEDLQERQRATAVLHVGAGHHHAQEQAQGIDQDMSLASFDLLVGVKAVDPPVSV